MVGLVETMVGKLVGKVETMVGKLVGKVDKLVGKMVDENQPLSRWCPRKSHYCNSLHANYTSGTDMY